MRSPRRAPVLAAVSALVMAPVLAGCGGSSGGSDAAPTEPNTVILKNATYRPSALTIKVGETVTWVWKDGSTQHDVKFEDESVPSSGFQNKGDYKVTFPKAGTFAYRCVIHPDMTGSITVV